MKRVFQEHLSEYCRRDYYPWHMPGHKRQAEWNSHCLDVCMDVTEVRGLDNLFASEGAIAASMQQITQIYGTKNSYYLVNGSTCGILTAISATCRRGDTIILSRNCHKSVYHAVLLLELKPIYIYPEVIHPYEICSSVTAQQVERALIEYPEAKAVIFPSPTYEGILSDVRTIAGIVHKHGAILIVDEAHGAHLEFGVQAPVSAVRCGADLVIQSLHKTLPCYTQCAILHIGNTETVDVALQAQVEFYLSVYQTSSPSYLFVANMEDAIFSMDEWRNTKMISYYETLRQYREQWKSLQQLHVLTPEEVIQAEGFAYDESKLVIAVPSEIMNGAELLQELEDEYGMILEMASLHYALAMTSVMDSQEAFQRFDCALRKIDNRLQKTDNRLGNRRTETNQQTEKMEKQIASIEAMEGTQAKDFITVYPPGIPILVPGEIVTKEHVLYLKQCIENSLTVQVRGK